MLILLSHRFTQEFYKKHDIFFGLGFQPPIPDKYVW